MRAGQQLNAERPGLLWTPSRATVERARITDYTRFLAHTRGLEFDGYGQPWEWSVRDLEAFWGSLWEYFAVRASSPYASVLADRRMPGTRWFPGARLSYAEHVFAAKPDDAVALVHASELRALAELTWAELRAETARVAEGLRRLGVGPGDRVVAYLPNIAETVTAFLACASLGAIWSSCSPDFGVRAVVDRFAQIEPKVLIAADGYRYGGRDFDRTTELARIQAGLPTLTHTVVVPYLGLPLALRGAVPWASLGSAGAELHCAQLPFAHPLWVLHTSGTTGSRSRSCTARAASCSNI